MRFVYPFLGLVVITLSLQSGAGAQDKDKDKGSKPPPDVVYVPENDKEMNEAMDKARKTADEFVKLFQKRQKSQSEFAVKVAIREGKKVEHFWVAISEFDGKQFKGIINNDAELATTVKAGDEVKVDKDKIGDWMYVDKKKLIGGYTVRVLRNRLSPEERKALDESIPYKID